MLVLGVVLIIFGALLAYFGRRAAADVAFWGGVLIFAGGAILFVIAILDVSGADTHAAVGGGMVAMALGGGGHASFHGAGVSEASVPVAGGPADRQPVVVAFAVAAVPIVCAFILQVLDTTDVLSSAPWLRTLLTGLGALVGALAAVWARARVTPTALPRLDDETPLIPMVEREGV